MGYSIIGLIGFGLGFIAGAVYAYEKAIEEYQSYEGLHGIMDIEEVCEEFGIEDINSEEAEIAYQEERESWLSYSAEEYDEENDEHVSALEEFGVWEV